MISNMKFRNSLFLIFNLFFIFVFLFLGHFALFNPYDKQVSVALTLLFLGAVLFGICFICFILNKLTKKQLIAISLINLSLLFLLQLFFGYYFAIRPSWDIGKIYSAASQLATGQISGLPEYFTVLYPNNIFVAILWTLFYKLCSFLGLNFIGSSIVLNIIFIFISVLITYFFIFKIFNLKIATISSFMFLLIVPFYIYSPIFYTDTLTMLFLPLAFLLTYHFLHTKKYRYLILVGTLISLGTAIKTNIVIGLIALIIYLLLAIDSFKTSIKTISIILISFLVCSSLITSISQSYIDVPLKEAGFPPTHWIMMGLKNVGSYNQEDVNASKAHGPIKNNIKDFNIATIKERLENYGFDGYSKFLYKKLEYTWGDGTYFGSELLSRKPARTNALHSYIYGTKSSVFKSFAEATHCLLLLLILIGSISLFKNSNKVGHLFNICIFGTFLFLIMWETKSRYLVCILPLFICSCSFGLNYISETIETLTSKH